MASEVKLRVVGKTEQQAVKAISELGLRVRVTKRDDNYLVGTRDHRVDRVNLEIVDGKVIRAYIG